MKGIGTFKIRLVCMLGRFKKNDFRQEKFKPILNLLPIQNGLLIEMGTVFACLHGSKNEGFNKNK